MRGLANARSIVASPPPECLMNEQARGRGASFVVLRNLRVKSLEFEFSHRSTRRIDWTAVVGGVVLKANAAIFAETERKIVVQAGSGEDWIVGLTVARVLKVERILSTNISAPQMSLQVKQLGPSFNPTRPQP